MIKIQKIEKGCSIILLSIIMSIFLSILMRIVVKNVLYEKMEITNGFVQFWLSNDITFTGGDEAEEVEEGVKEIDWAILYPFEEEDIEDTDHRGIDVFASYKGKVQAVKDKLDRYTNKFLLMYDDTIIAQSALEYMADWRLTAQRYEGVLYMKDGSLAGTCEKLSEGSIEVLADNLKEFEEFLENNDIPLIYANAGSNVCPFDDQLFDSPLENSNENADALLKAFNARGIDTIDFREEIKKDGLDWHSMYYRTDHHWTTDTALWAAGKLAQKMNDEYDFSFDTRLFEKNFWNTTHYKDFWLGSRGRRVTLARTGLDDYDLMLPDFQTELILKNPGQDQSLSGDYKEVVMKMDEINGVNEYSGTDYLNAIDAYDCTNTARICGPVLSIHNNLTENRKKILLLRDSYSDYLFPFLACDTEEVDSICPDLFNGSIRNYIEKTKPDIEVVLYWINGVEPLSLDHYHRFDFR